MTPAPTSRLTSLNWTNTIDSLDSYLATQRHKEVIDSFEVQVSV